MADEDSTIEELLDRWEKAHAGGTTLHLDALCANHPELRDEIARRISALMGNDRRGSTPRDEEDSALPLAPTFPPRNRRKSSDHDAPCTSPELTFASHIGSLRFHAKGGLGSVFVGTDGKLNRQVAIKFIHPALAGDSMCRERFQLEAEVTGRLEHPGVIPMYGSGESQDGRPFYAMRFIDGHTLDKAIRQFYERAERREELQSVEFRRLLNSFLSVCETVAYAHNRGIVHRDIKPDNVMLGRYGETIVVDWGLAVPVTRDERFRASGEKTLLPVTGGSNSSSGDGAGTPAYMSPEQASELAPTPASDIYSLGATLFKILTGQPPVSGTSLQEIRTKVVEGRIPRPADLRKGVPRPLQAICLKAMSLRPVDRYATALDLARDVERYLADEPVEVYRETIGQTFSRFLRRNRTAAMVAFVGLTSCLFLAGFASVWLAQSAHQASMARINAEGAQRQAEIARRDNLGTSAMYLAKSLASEIDLRWRILEAEASSPKLRQLMSAINQARHRSENAETETGELQRWLEKRWIVNSDAVRSVCWAVNSVDGTQVARVPETVGGKRVGSLGKNYRHRDYFHGEGRDLTPEELAQRGEILPLADKDVYISAVFESTNTKTLMVTFSVPVWSGPPEDVTREKIGTLASPVELGNFSLGSHAMLVDTRLDQLNRRPGLVLHHPDMGRRSSGDRLPYLADAGLRLAQQANESQLDEVNVTPTFVDPVRGEQRLAAVEPVVIRGRKRPGRDTGWVVIAMEDRPAIVAP